MADNREEADNIHMDDVLLARTQVNEFLNRGERDGVCIGTHNHVNGCDCVANYKTYVEQSAGDDAALAAAAGQSAAYQNQRILRICSMIKACRDANPQQDGSTLSPALESRLKLLLRIIPVGNGHSKKFLDFGPESERALDLDNETEIEDLVDWHTRGFEKGEHNADIINTATQMCRDSGFLTIRQVFRCYHGCYADDATTREVAQAEFDSYIDFEQVWRLWLLHGLNLDTAYRTSKRQKAFYAVVRCYYSWYPTEGQILWRADRMHM